MAKVCPTCPMWIQIRGTDPNTGQEVDGFNCAIAWGPMLTIENSHKQMQTGAAVESLRNVVAAAQVPRIGSFEERRVQVPSQEVKQINDHS